MFNHKKAQLSKTGFILVISSFYIFLGIGLGLYGQTFSTPTIEHQSILTANNETDQASGFFSKVSNIKIFSFLGNIITGIKELPPILNTLIFSPLFIVMLWIVISSLPTFNGGG